MKLSYIILLVASLALASCSSRTPLLQKIAVDRPTLSIALISKDTPIPVRAPAIDPTLTASPIPKYTQKPATTVSEKELERIEARTPSSTPAPTITSKPTPAVSDNPPSTSDPYDQILLSPDKRFVAKLYNEYVYHTGRPTIEISDNTGSLLWTIPFQGEMPTGDPHPYLSLYKWSSDSSSLYFYNAFSFDGYYTLWDGLDLQLIRIATGKAERVLPGKGLMAFAFSPGEQYVAYTRDQDQPRRLIVRNLTNDSESMAKIDLKSDNYTQAGWISSSPNGDKILFHTENQERIQAILLDVDSMKQQLLLEFWGEEYWFSGWSENGVMYLHSPDNEVINIDVTTGITTTIGTATPVP